jgi:multisite-specific tRNA:(cytosine-C5)-methyltransferase
MEDRYFPQISAVEYEGELVDPPKPSIWYPDQLAYSMTTPKNIIRRFAPFASFQKFLVSETAVGNISRQELVSMIPPLLIDIKPGMTVLDMCAAPGSKTAQLIEMVHKGEEVRVRKVLREVQKQEGRELSPDGFEVDSVKDEVESDAHMEDDGRATGLVIANDSDYKRCHMLIHQTKRLNSPNLIVTNHDSTIFPSIKLPSPPGSHQKYLKFDRILCDVPCSGDGTCRKNPGVWKDWVPGNGLGLHITQVRILVRGLQNLKVGGKLVYSTCSMNPVENEAVIASAIERCGGSSRVRLLDCKDEIPDLKRNKGLTEWGVMSKSGNIYHTWAELEQAKANGTTKDGDSKLSQGMFPPGPVSGEGGHGIQLDRCMRVYAHQQDTGAFFITVMEKLAEIKAKPENTPRNTESTIAETNGKAETTQPSIVAVAEEIKAKGFDPEHPIQKIESLDALMPPVPPTEFNDSAAARSNQEVEVPLTSVKREREVEEADAEVDGLMANKRAKTLLEPAAAAQGEEERAVHFPPPPSQPLQEGLSAPVPLVPESSVPFKKKGGPPQEEPFKFLPEDDEDMTQIYNFYGISERFPKNRFLVRNVHGKATKAVYYASQLAKDILVENEGNKIRFVHCGVKMFMKQDVQKDWVCPWRIQSEGLPILEGWASEKRVVRLYKKETFKLLLKEMFPKVYGDGWEHLGEIGERVKDLDMGCTILRVEVSDAKDGFK